MKQREVRVFLAAPGDLLDEREVFDGTLAELSHESGGQIFRPLKWEQALATTGVRPQSVINELVDTCDVFVLAMYRRFGQSAPDSPAARSYTEEEFRRALARLNRTGSPEIVCFFRQIDPAQLADAGPELMRVLQFRSELEQSRQVLYRSFATASAFGTVLRDHLIAFVRGELPTLRHTRSPIVLAVPDDTQPRDEAELEARRLTDGAAFSLRQNDPVRAAQLLAQASQITTNVRLLDAIKDFFEQRGEIITAQCVEDKRLALTRDRRLAARRYVGAMPPIADSIIAASASQLPAEVLPVYAAAMREALDSDEFRDRMASDMAEHFTTGELNALTRFFTGEAKSVMEKLGHFMGDSVPRAIDRTNAILRARGFDV